MLYVRRAPFQPSPVPHKDSMCSNPLALKNVCFTEKQKALLNPVFVPFSENNLKYDLVYILKQCDINPDLRYSLRSISKFCTFRKIWFVGYKPTWTQNVNFVPTVQTANKWKNSVLNYKTACQTKEISENFILMNDDFFAIRQIVDWETDTNKCLGTLDDKIKELSKLSALSKWQKAFSQVKELLIELGSTNFYNYEAHLPIIINKQHFLELLETNALKKFEKTDKVLHKRSVYMNLYKDPTLIPKVIEDVKLLSQKDLNSQSLDENWLSVFDYVIDNVKCYPQINKLFRLLFPEKCIYEK